MLKLRSLLISILFFPFLTTGFEAGEKNYYEILGVSKEASKKEIRDAYIDLAKKYHTDRYPGDSEKIVEINNAYEILKDSKKRENYDRYLRGEEFFNKAEGFNHFFETFRPFEESLNKRPFDQKNASHQQEGQSFHSGAKVLQLFQLILINRSHFNNMAAYQTNPRIIKKQQQLTEAALKEILKEARIPNLNPTSQRRILHDLYQNFPETTIKELIRDSSSPDNKQRILRISFVDFIEDVKEWYEVQNITGKERQAIEIFRRFSFLNRDRIELLAEQEKYSKLLSKKKEKQLTAEEKNELRDFERQNKADLRVFRNILSVLGLPGTVYNDTILRSYLEGLKETLVQNLPDKKTLLPDHSNNQRRNTKIHIRDVDVINVFKNIKFMFDEIHYQNLEAMSGKNFLKNFPAQFIIFQAAIGASIYRQSLTDPYLYGAERNPEMLINTLSQTLSPSGVVSFAIFISVSQQVHKRLYGSGRLVDGSSFKTPFVNISFNGKWGRTLAPGTGLGIGFFISSLFDELIHDKDLQQCAKQQFDSARETSRLNAHIEPCEALLLNWTSSEKWKHYAVDIATLVGSGLLSHKLFEYTLKAIRTTALGESALLRAGKLVGPRFAGWIGFFVSIYYFMELHKIIDELIGQPLKEQLTARSTKNNIEILAHFLEQDLSGLSLYDDSESNPNQSPFSFDEKISNTEQKIKQIGHKFQHWTNVKAQFYHQSVHLWTKQLNKLLLPYEGSSQLLKDIFINSHLKYGLGVNRDHVWAWDSDGEIQNENREWDLFNTSIGFSLEKFSQLTRQSFLTNKYCSKVTEKLSSWYNLCTNNGGYTDWELPYETAYLIYENLTASPANSDRPEGNHFDFMPYLGRGLDEMFSSDPHYSVKRLSQKERFQLSKALMKEGLEDNSLSHFTFDEISRFKETLCANWYPAHETDAEERELYNYCYNPSQNANQIEDYCSDYKIEGEDDESYNSCLNFFYSVEDYLSEIITNKFLSAGIYLLKELLNEEPADETAEIRSYADFIRRNGDGLTGLQTRLDWTHSFSYFVHNSLGEGRTPSITYIRPLVALLHVHKKGGKYFLFIEEELETQKANMDSEAFKELEASLSLSSNPYLFTKNLVCGGDKNSDDVFIAPLFFSHPEIFIYDFSSNQFVSIELACESFIRLSELHKTDKKIFHDLLFNRPVQTGGRNYENLYLALEAILRNNYSSSEKLAQDFQKFSQDQLDSIGGRLAGQLEDLTDNYYKNIIHFDSEVNHNSPFQDLTSYYHKDNILTGRPKGLEIPLFQVNYWMNILKELLVLGDQNQLNQETFFNWRGFDQTAFESMQFEILVLLQSYHDSYKQEQGPYLVLPDQDLIQNLHETFKIGNEELVDQYGNTSRLFILQQEYKGLYPVLIPDDIILSHILASSIPPWNNSGQINLLNSDPTTRTGNKGWKKLIHSVTFELNRSLISFSSQLQALNLKESFESQLPHSDSQLQ